MTLHTSIRFLSVLRWAYVSLAARRGPRRRHALPASGPATARRRLYIVWRMPALSFGASTRQRPAEHLPRAAAWPYILYEDGSPVRPYVLPPAERARVLQEGAR